MILQNKMKKMTVFWVKKLAFELLYRKASKKETENT